MNTPNKNAMDYYIRCNNCGFTVHCTPDESYPRNQFEQPGDPCYVCGDKDDGEYKEIPKPRAPGGGRKPLHKGEPTIKRTVTLTEAQWSKAERIGKGNRSAGIRAALEHVRTPKDK